MLNPDAPIRDGLVLWFKMTEGEGTVVYDASGNDNNGTVYGGAAWTEYWRDETVRLTSLRHRITGRQLEAVDFELVNTDIRVGQKIRVKRGASIVFEGIIYERRKRQESGVLEVDATAYSELIAYDRHVVYRMYNTGTTAGAIIRDLAALESGVDVTNVDDGPASPRRGRFRTSAHCRSCSPRPAARTTICA